jgi:hypothetical protein
MTLDDYLSGDYSEVSSYCGECEGLTDALRDTERLCREAEDQQIRASVTYAGKDAARLVRGDLECAAKIRAREQDRNRALDALCSHQRLRH